MELFACRSATGTPTGPSLNKKKADWTVGFCPAGHRCIGFPLFFSVILTEEDHHHAQEVAAHLSRRRP
jgi:hypothetical protein